jgi:hypothetical protein
MTDPHHMIVTGWPPNIAAGRVSQRYPVLL